MIYDFHTLHRYLFVIAEFVYQFGGCNATCISQNAGEHYIAVLKNADDAVLVGGNVLHQFLAVARQIAKIALLFGRYAARFE